MFVYLIYLVENRSHLQSNRCGTVCVKETLHIPQLQVSKLPVFEQAPACGLTVFLYSKLRIDSKREVEQGEMRAKPEAAHNGL
jgi:hypothetical protein